MSKLIFLILLFNVSYSQYLDIQYASFSYTIGGSYGSCVKFIKSEYNSSDYGACSCAWAANTSSYPNCYELFYNPQTKMIKYNLSEGGEYIYRNFSNDYTCHIYYEEIEILECSEMDEFECGDSGDCDWVENIEYGNCSNYSNGSTCDADENCFWDLCYGGSYGSWSHCCRGGTYQIDNSYCLEVEAVIECFEMNQLQCFQDSSCEWISDIEIASCGSLTGSDCELAPGCDWECWSDPTGYIPGCTYSCTGGTYELNNSYCQEVSFLPGDANGDGSLNVSDIVLIVDLILGSDYDENSDINQDGILNIMDIVEIISNILT